MARYRLPDEPRPSSLSHLAVDPVWPLFGAFFAPMALAWGWALFNGWAMGAPRRARDVALVVAGLMAVVPFLFVVGLFVNAGFDVAAVSAYGFVLLTGFRLTVSYLLYLWQHMPAQLHAHYGGTLRNGGVVVALGFVLQLALGDQIPAGLRLWLG